MGVTLEDCIEIMFMVEGGGDAEEKEGRHDQEEERVHKD